MLDFRPKGGPTRNYFARREQRKLLGLVLAVGLVVLLIETAANPRRWQWMLNAPGQAGAQPAAKGERRAKVEQPASLRKRTTHVDEFIAEAEPNEAIAADKRFFAGVRPELLAKVRDDTVFRAAESDAFYHLLKILDETSEANLEQASMGPVSFTQLFTQPKEFRGDLVTVAGTVRRVLMKAAPDNKYGIQEYSQVVLEPDDREYPVVIYCLELPQAFPRGEKLHEPVAVTGFFYKRWAGLSGEGIATWPLLLSKTLRWQPHMAAAAQPEGDTAGLRGLMIGLAVALVASLFVAAFVVSSTRRRTRFLMPQARPGDLDRLREREVGADVGEQLAQLARQEQP